MSSKHKQMKKKQREREKKKQKSINHHSSGASCSPRDVPDDIMIPFLAQSIIYDGLRDQMMVDLSLFHDLQKIVMDPKLSVVDDPNFLFVKTYLGGISKGNVEWEKLLPHLKNVVSFLLRKGENELAEGFILKCYWNLLSSKLPALNENELCQFKEFSLQKMKQFDLGFYLDKYSNALQKMDEAFTLLVDYPALKKDLKERNPKFENIFKCFDFDVRDCFDFASILEKITISKTGVGKIVNERYKKLYELLVTYPKKYHPDEYAYIFKITRLFLKLYFKNINPSLPLEHFLTSEHLDLRVLLFPESLTLDDLKALLINPSQERFSPQVSEVLFKSIDVSRMSSEDLIRYRTFRLRHLWSFVDKGELKATKTFSSAKEFSQELKFLFQAILKSPSPEKKLGPFFSFLTSFELCSDLFFAIDLDLLVDLAEHSKDHFVLLNWAYIYSHMKFFATNKRDCLDRVLALLKNVKRLTREDSKQWDEIIILLLSKKDSKLLSEYYRLFFPLYTQETKESFWKEFHRAMTSFSEKTDRGAFYLDYFKSSSLKNVYSYLPPFESSSTCEHVEHFLERHPSISTPMAFHQVFAFFLQNKRPIKLAPTLTKELTKECQLLSHPTCPFNKSLSEFKVYLTKMEGVL